MANSEGIKEKVNQVAIQATLAVMMVFRHIDTGYLLATTPIQQETQKQRHGRLIVEKPKFNWDTQDRNLELLNFKLEITKIKF